MEPNLLPTKEPRTFRSEAEYRLWQHKLAANISSGDRGPGLVSRIVKAVRSMAPQKHDAPRKKSQRVSGRPAKQHS